MSPRWLREHRRARWWCAARDADQVRALALIRRMPDRAIIR